MKMEEKKKGGKLYEFTEDGNSCVICDPAPPRHWYNYLWNEDRYCAQVSQTGHGRSYYLSEKAEMCMINRDDARYVYVRDDESKDAWNIGQGPLNAEVKDYACTHSIGYSQITSERDEVKGSWRIFVPEKGFHEVWTLKFRNEGMSEKRLSVFSAVSFSLEGFSYPRYYEMYRCMSTSFDRELNGVYCDSSHPFAPHGLYHGFLASTEPVYAYDGNLAGFCGSASTLTLPDASACALFQRPDVVMQGGDCTNSEASLFILGGVLQHKDVYKRQYMNSMIPQPREDSEIFEQYATAIPIGTAIAQSWNPLLAECCGDIVGSEMERFGIHLWLAPALNIHRSIRCGRNYEYFSEDPLISGVFAAALTKGVQSHPGCGVTIKHFAANNQETNRYNNNSVASERALREIYLKGFEICVHLAQPKALMTSYNLLNGVHTSERKDLLGDVLRSEFGFKGIVMTDWVTSSDILSAGAKYPAPEAYKVALAGNDLFMPGSRQEVDNLTEALKDGFITREDLMRNATRIYRMAMELSGASA